MKALVLISLLSSAALGLVARTGGLPAVDLDLAFLVGRAHVQRRTLVVGTDGTGAQQRAQRGRGGAAGKKAIHGQHGVAHHVCSMEAADPSRRARPRAAHRRKRSR